jgi:hypothetical protein
MKSIPPFTEIPVQAGANSGSSKGPDLNQVFQQHNQLLEAYAYQEFPKKHIGDSLPLRFVL